MKQIFSLNPHLHDELRRRSELLRLISVCLLVLLPIFAVASGLDNGNLDIYVGYTVCFIASFIGFYCNRLGRVALGGWILVSGVIVAIGYYLTKSTEIIGDVQRVAPVLVTIVILAGMIIYHWAAPVVGLVCSLMLITISLLQSNSRTQLIIANLATPICLLLVASVVSWYYGRSFVRLVNQLTERNKRLEEANFQIQAKHQLEIQIGDQINLLAAHVSAAFAEQTRGANDQLSAVVEVTAALEELNQTNQQIARAAGEVAETARDALSVAEMGGSTIRYSTEAMHMLHAKVGETVNAMQNLSVQAREIDQIIELITEVAEETNLLALNATIEAAGAGEYGRRFAAVANEVQRLANRSRDAADAVRGVVNEVQDAVKASSFVSQESLREAFSLTGTAREIGESIEGIVQMVQNTATLAQQISLSIQQQKSAGTQVLDTMRQISNISDRVALNSRELMETIVELNEAADRLKTIDKTDELNNPPDNQTGPDSKNQAALVNLRTLNPITK